jgi:hypothetical protein
MAQTDPDRRDDVRAAAQRHGDRDEGEARPRPDPAGRFRMP